VPVTKMMIHWDSPTVLAIAGALSGLVVARIGLRRRLLLNGVSPSSMRRLDFTLSLLAIGALAAGFSPYLPQLSDTVNILIWIAVVAIGGLVALPRENVWRSVGSFVLGAVLLLGRYRVFEYTDRGGLLFEHLTPFVYLAAVLALFVFAGMSFFFKNPKLPKS